MRVGGRLPWKALALGLGIWAFAGPPAVGGDPSGPARKGWLGGWWHHEPGIPAAGTLGYGPPGVHSGYQGFGLGYHLGHGYGGDALGVGSDGGYPFYGGPGYPHPEPPLRRCKGIDPFPYYGGPGYPSAHHPNYFGGVGPLVDDPPVVTSSGPGGAGWGGEYGYFTGALPDPEAAFAPATVGAGGPAGVVGASYAAPPSASNPPAPGRRPSQARSPVR